MKISEVLEAVHMIKPRGCGYTHKLCKIAKELDGTVLVNSDGEARRLRDTYLVKSISVHKELRGTKGPYFLDSTACMALVSGIYRLEKENHELKAQLTKGANNERTTNN